MNKNRIIETAYKLIIEEKDRRFMIPRGWAYTLQD